MSELERAATTTRGGNNETMAESISESVAVGAVSEPGMAYQAGNEADFERLYQASYGKILGTLTAILGDRSAAEDCAQDAFERAYKKWSNWQPIAPAEAWVHRIAVNAAVSHQRKMRLREVGEVIRRIGPPRLAPDPQELVQHRDLAAALAKLPPNQVAAIVLRHYHGYTNRAIAQALGIPERTVASRLAVAKERLRVMLKNSYGPGSGIEEPVGEPRLARPTSLTPARLPAQSRHVRSFRFDLAATGRASDRLPYLVAPVGPRDERVDAADAAVADVEPLEHRWQQLAASEGVTQPPRRADPPSA